MNRNGFIATSVIYAFFIVFLLLMASILLFSAQNRILINAVKSDIREELANTSGYITYELENKTYTVGSEVEYAGETWIVVKNNSSSVLLILSRSLTAVEISSAIAKDRSNTEYYGTCNSTACQVRACRQYYGGEDYCYYYPSYTNVYRRPTWNPLDSQTSNSINGYAQTIPAAITRYWFTYHDGLQKALSEGKLVAQSFNDGYFTYPQSGQDAIYVRLLLRSEIANGSSFAASLSVPFHLATVAGTTSVYVYNASRQVAAVTSNTAAYIYPVIEVKKG